MLPEAFNSVTYLAFERINRVPVTCSLPQWLENQYESTNYGRKTGKENKENKENQYSPFGELQRLLFHCLFALYIYNGC